MLYWRSSEYFLQLIPFLLPLRVFIVRTLFKRQIVFVFVSSFINFSVFCQAIKNHAEILLSVDVSEDKTSEKQTYHQAREAAGENTLLTVLYEFDFCLCVVEGKMHIHCPLWSSIYRKCNDSVTVVLFWHILSLYWIEALDRRFLINSHSTAKQNFHHSKMSMEMRSYSMQWTLRHPVVQRLRCCWDTHRFKRQPNMKHNKDANPTSSVRKLTKHNYPPLDFFFPSDVH